jgi:hypothetical protein
VLDSSADRVNTLPDRPLDACCSGLLEIESKLYQHFVENRVETLPVLRVVKC